MTRNAENICTVLCDSSGQPALLYQPGSVYRSLQYCAVTANAQYLAAAARHARSRMLTTTKRNKCSAHWSNTVCVLLSIIHACTLAMVLFNRPCLLLSEPVTVMCSCVRPRRLSRRYKVETSNNIHCIAYHPLQVGQRFCFGSPECHPCVDATLYKLCVAIRQSIGHLIVVLVFECTIIPLTVSVVGCSGPDANR